MLRIPHCIDNPLADSGKVVSPMHQPRSTLQKHYFSATGTHFCQRFCKPQAIVWLEGLGKLKKIIYHNRSQTSDLPVCSIVP
jgi:hypothetical protein